MTIITSGPSFAADPASGSRLLRTPCTSDTMHLGHHAPHCGNAPRVARGEASYGVSAMRVANWLYVAARRNSESIVCKLLGPTAALWHTMRGRTT
jgi:hypothetical protein